MEYSPYAFVGAYIGVMSFMVTLIAMVIAAVGITFLEINRQRLNKVLLWIFRIISWMVLLIAATYTFLSLYNVVAQLILNVRKS